MQLLRKIAYPFSWIYQVVVAIRNLMYDIGWFSSQTTTTPTVCVGNLSVGGTGKTPMVEFLIATLKDSHKLAVLSRGYGRKSKGFFMASSNSTVETLGDEPYQIYSKFPGVALAVDVNRLNGVRLLKEKVNPDIIILDDAFQHRKIKPHLSILLTAYNQLYSDDCYLPTGDLRDSRSQAKRANYIIVTKCPPNLTKTQRQELKARLQPKPYQQVLFSYLAYSSTLGGFQNKLTLNDLKEKEVTLVTGIAKPEPLVNYLKEQGISFEHLRYKDHHFFTEKQVTMLTTKTCVLTTEKDCMRLDGKIKQLGYIGVKHVFYEDGKTNLSQAIKALK